MRQILIEANELKKTLPKSILEEAEVYIDETEEIEAIPIEWIIDWLAKQTIPATSYGLDCSAIHKMLDDWKKENEH